MVTTLITYNSEIVNLNNGFLIFVDVLAIILISDMLIFILYNETLQFAQLLFFFLSQDSRHECHYQCTSQAGTFGDAKVIL